MDCMFICYVFSWSLSVRGLHHETGYTLPTNAEQPVHAESSECDWISGDSPGSVG